jgi:CDP-diacylglycerol--serine O-phosphatidyltransferase
MTLSQLAPKKPKRKLRATATLPAMVTLLNGICGFASIYYATKAGTQQEMLTYLSTAAWLIYIAMVFDALDGRLARMTRSASDFGTQLDSLCDAISFGVAPAMLMVQTVSKSLGGLIGDFEIFRPQAPGLGKVVMVIGALYVCCAILRLARFNVENAHDVLHHMSFKGLPSPGAAAAVAALVLLFAQVEEVNGGWMAAGWLHLDIVVGVTLPVATLLVALLMVSSFRYPHLMNQFVRGRRPFAYLVKGMVIIMLGILLQQLGLALATLLYALSGPVGAVRRKLAGPKEQGSAGTA